MFKKVPCCSCDWGREFLIFVTVYWFGLNLGRDMSVFNGLVSSPALYVVLIYINQANSFRYLSVSTVGYAITAVLLKL